MYIRSLLFLSCLITIPSFAQQRTNQSTPDTNSIRSKWLKGKIESRFRLYMMSTDNASGLSDYHALAFGGGLKYESGAWYGLSFGVSGFFIWNLASADLSKKDPKTGARSRYEIGQFDAEDPGNRNDMDRLEDFYLQYKWKSGETRFGKQEIKTPFVNPQDGRMRPTGEQGVWTQWEPGEKWKLQGGWIYKMSPRGTVRWYGVAESMGLFPAGVNEDGRPSGYPSNLESNGIGILGLQYQHGQMQIQAWEHLVEGIFHTSMFQLEKKPSTTKPQGFETGFQYIYQQSLANGGHYDPAKAYFQQQARVHVLSAKAGWKYKQALIRLNATHIGKNGRFLMPREWGREPFYTFIPRERNEGSGGVNAVTMNIIRENPRKKWRTEISYGYYDMPDVKDARLNKYQMPSYHHFLADVKYAFRGMGDGLSIELLYAYKKNAGETYRDPKYLINKVDMHHFNIILNYIL